MVTKINIEDLIDINSNFPFFIQEAFLASDFPLHTHNFSELVLVISGSGTHIIDNEYYFINSGCIYVVKGNTTHGFKNTKNLKMINIMYDNERFLFEMENLKQMADFHALFLLEPIL